RPGRRGAPGGPGGNGGVRGRRRRGDPLVGDVRHGAGEGAVRDVLPHQPPRPRRAATAAGGPGAHRREPVRGPGGAADGDAGLRRPAPVGPGREPSGTYSEQLPPLQPDGPSPAIGRGTRSFSHGLPPLPTRSAGSSRVRSKTPFVSTYQQ